MAPDLHQLGTDLLAVALATFADASITPPDRHYVADGPQSGIAIDQEQLVAIVGPVVEGPPGGTERSGRLGAGFAWMTTLFLDCARPAPIVDDAGWPTPDEIEASAQRIQADGAVLLRTVSRFAATCRPVYNPALTWIGPEGGYTRAVLSFEVAVV